jgi:nitrite reductase/ring-hydroxylating ferredoxin subunit
MEPLAQPVPLCRLEAIPDRGATAIDVPSGEGAEVESLILLRNGSQVRAFRNVCPHTGRRLDYAPGKFLLKGNTIICAVHGATFTTTDGLCSAGPCRGDHLHAVAVTVDAGEVSLQTAPIVPRA